MTWFEFTVTALAIWGSYKLLKDVVEFFAPVRR